MEIHLFKTKEEMGRAAADCAAGVIDMAVQNRGEANIALATGASQFEMLVNLVAHDLEWSKVTAFHLDEYMGLPASHPASFRRYLKERFVEKVPLLCEFHFIDGDGPDPDAELRRLNDLIRRVKVDLACIGIGENGHIAFNDPPADFVTDAPFLVVDLDQACRRQQVGEGWFASEAEVPRQAISMSVQQIMKASCIVCTVRDQRKTQALKAAVEEEITNRVPASILQEHGNCHVFADEAAGSLLRGGNPLQ